MWLTGCRKQMHRNSSVGWKPVPFVNCETTTAARSVAVTLLRKPRGDPVNVPLENGIRKCLMSSELPFVSCLCPTYRRPQMMANTIPCFITQDYPADRRELIILDDAGDLQNETSEGWQIISIPRRFRSLRATAAGRTRSAASAIGTRSTRYFRGRRRAGWSPADLRGPAAVRRRRGRSRRGAASAISRSGRAAQRSSATWTIGPPASRGPILRTEGSRHATRPAQPRPRASIRLKAAALPMS